MGQSADQLRQEIAQKRGDAAQKIDAIQNQVEEAVHKVEDTAEQVKENFNIRHQIEERPLLALGAALIAGFALGGMTGGGNEHNRSQHRQTSTAANQGQWQSSNQQRGGVTGAIQHLAKETGIESTVSDMASAFLATVTDKVKSAVDEGFPGFAAKFQQTQRSNGDVGAKTRAAEHASPATTDASGRPVAYYPSSGGAAPNVHD